MDPKSLYSVEAEAATLGSIIVSQKHVVVADVLCILPNVEAFFLLEHQKLYECLIEMLIERIPIDAVMLRTKLRAKGWLEDIGGVEYIGRVMESVPNELCWEYYAKAVAEKYQFRKLIQLKESIGTIIDDGEGDVEAKADEIRQLILTQTQTVRSGYHHLTGENGLERILSPASHTIATHFWQIDKMIGGLSRGELTVIAARPGMGKTSLALSLVANVVEHDEAGALIISLEQKAPAIESRMLARKAHVNTKSLLTTENQAKLREAAEWLKSKSVFLSDGANTIEAAAAVIHQVKVRAKIDVVVLDYLQLLRATKAGKTRNDEIGAMTRAIKEIAFGENVAFVLLSQLNRQCEQRPDKHPHLADLRESGSIEQDADYVMLLFWQDYYRKQEAVKKEGHESERLDGIAEVNIAKAKDNEAGIVRLLFMPQFTSYENISHAEQ